ncbi:MAG: baeRF3 domain-containing protein [Acidimicrobiales bacterium]
MERTEILELARRAEEPAVTIMMPVQQPVAAHPDHRLRLGALVDKAVEAVESSWGRAAADSVRAQIDSAEVEVTTDERGHGLAVLATPEDIHVLHLPFAVDEQVAVGPRFVVRQLLEGLARTPRYRVLVLAGHDARLFEGRGGHLSEIDADGFPLTVEPPHEWDAPQHDLPIHEEAEKEEHRFVYRAVDDALGAISTKDPLPVVVTAAPRELAFFDEVTRHADLIAGRVHGNFSRSNPVELADAVAPAVAALWAGRRSEAVSRLGEARGHGRAAVGLPDVRQAAAEGRGHELVIEEGFDTDDSVDAVIQTVLLDGGEVEFVEPGALDEHDHIGLVLRYA